MLNGIEKASWPKIIFTVFAGYNGLLLAATGIISVLMLETPSLWNFVKAVWFCNLVLLMVVGIPFLIAMALIYVYLLITKKEIMPDECDGEHISPTN